MKHHVRQPPSHFTQALIVLFLHGCAAGGAAFEKPTPPPANQAMICFYRPADIFGGAWSVHVQDNGQEIAALDNGQFRELPISVGHHEFSDGVTGDTAVIIDVVAGETYYLRVGMIRDQWNMRVSAATASRTFMRAYPEDAQNELRRCCKRGSDSQ